MKYSGSTALKKTEPFLLFAAALAAACGLLIFPSDAADGARNGIGYCLNILVPSLFPFMVLSTFLVKSGLSEQIGRVLGGATRVLFRLPGCTAATILMSMIGGYPVGARGIAALREAGSITDREAERMLCFCINAGPAFVISVVGSSLLRSAALGVILFFSQIGASILLGILSGLTTRKENRPAPSQKSGSGGAALVLSVSDAAKGMLNMCTFVILFAVLLAVLRASGAAQAVCQLLLRLGFPPSVSAVLLSILLEVTGGCYDAASMGAGLALLSFGIGWGGLCVHFQVLSSVTFIRLSRLKFTLFRLLHGLAAALLTTALLMFFPQSVETFGSAAAPLSAQISGSGPAAAALVVLCAAFLMSVGGGGGKTKKGVV